MENVRCHILLVVFALVAAVNSQSYPRFEFRGIVLVNNSYILWPNIGEGHNDSLHCVTDNSDCCSNGEGNWYDRTGEVEQGPDRNNSLYVTRGDGVVYLNRRRGGSSGMWRCDIPDSNGVLQSIYIYLGTPMTGVWLCLWCFLSLLDCSNCPQVGCYQQSSPSLWGLRLMRILLSSLSHVRVEEDQSQRWSGGGME